MAPSTPPPPPLPSASTMSSLRPWLIKPFFKPALGRTRPCSLWRSATPPPKAPSTTAAITRKASPDWRSTSKTRNASQQNGRSSNLAAPNGQPNRFRPTQAARRASQERRRRRNVRAVLSDPNPGGQSQRDVEAIVSRANRSTTPSAQARILTAFRGFPRRCVPETAHEDGLVNRSAVARFMIFDLEFQKLVNGVECGLVVSRDLQPRPAWGVLQVPVNLILKLGHGCRTGNVLVVHQHRRIEIASCEHLGDMVEVTPNLIAALGVLYVVGADIDQAAVVAELKMMGRLLV